MSSKQTNRESNKADEENSMLRLTTANQEKGSALILAIVMLAAVSALGITMITLGKNQVEMSTNLKLHEIARYNSDSCTVGVSKLIRHIVDASNEGTIGFDAGTTTAPGVSYPTSTDGDTPAVEFANKVLFGEGTDDQTCEDVSFNTVAIDNSVQTASGGNFAIDATRELDSAADIRGKFVVTAAGSAGPEFDNASSEGLGGGGAGGGGMTLKFVVACRGRAPNNALHVGYSVYRKTIGVGKGE
jgi:hypothetical protein